MISVSPGWIVLPTWHSGVAAIHTAGVTTQVILRTVTMPAGFPGPNGVIRVTMMWRQSETTNSKIMRCRIGAAGAGLGGDAIYNETLTSSVETNRRSFEFHNANSAAIQISSPTAMGSGGWGTSSGTLFGSVIDTAAAWELCFTTIVATVTEFCELRMMTIEGLYGA